MDLEELKNKVKNFETKAGFNKTKFAQFIPMLERSDCKIKKNPENKKLYST